MLNTPHLKTFNFTQNIKYHSFTKDNLVKLYSRQQKVLNSFWQIWRRNYLQFIKERFKNFRKKRSKNTESQIGDIVQIPNNDKPRIQWKIGKIVKLHFGRDNCICSADISFSNNSIIHRPISMIYPFEHEDE